MPCQDQCRVFTASQGKHSITTQPSCEHPQDRSLACFSDCKAGNSYQSLKNEWDREELVLMAAAHYALFMWVLVAGPQDRFSSVLC